MEGVFMTTMTEHYITTDDDAEAIWFLGTLAKIKADSKRTGGAFSIVEFTHPPGFHTPPHVHADSDEAFYVLSGEMHGFCGDTEWHAGPGDVVWLPRGVPHGYGTAGDQPLRSLAINLPGGFDEFVVGAGVPAAARELPPPMEIDPGRVDAEAAQVGITHLGPPPAPPT
jgi:quercetin dioxygenase-like cupin family protein